jgi:peptide-methionine (S)-S-oxide reductase
MSLLSRLKASPGRIGAVSLAAVLVATVATGHFPGLRAHAADLDRRLPAPLVDEAAASGHTETAIFAGGCFWGVQGTFQHVRGVTEALSGYDGGHASTAQYETVSTGTTGHAESVRVTFDPQVISYGHLLQIFFSVVTDPTEVNEQYPDSGTQYRSELFTTSAAQAKVASLYIAQLDQAKAFSAPIATIVGHNTGFYPAEGYHQNYLTLNPNSDYIATFDLPKVAALSHVFPAYYLSKPVLVPDSGKS